MRQEVKLSLFGNDMILYIENPKDTTRKLLELILSLVKLQDTKLTYRNWLHFCILTISVLSEGGVTILSNKLPRNKPT